MPVSNLDQIDSVVARIQQESRVPGVAVAIVADGQVIFARGYGYRDLEAKHPMTARTIYPIASTSKALNATLLGTLVDEGKLAWDAPVQTYLAGFRLGDPVTSTRVTVRDLVTMRTGLPRHDWVWMEHAISRADLVERLRHLELSAGFRERFQYNNLTTTTAGHLAEIVTGESWEELLRKRILDPLEMSSTGFSEPTDGEVTLMYHENSRRELVRTRRIATDVGAPAGGSIHSHVEDMARWAAFNLNGGKVAGRSLIREQTLAELHFPQVVVGADPAPPSPEACYGMGWFVDVYNGCARVSHGGYLHDVNSEIMIFPQQRIGVVSTTNFGPPRVARLINQQVFDMLMGFTPASSLAEVLSGYERSLQENRRRISSVRRVQGTTPAHDLDDHVGSYIHPGYGRIDIARSGGQLGLRREGFAFALEHWHYDAWVFEDTDWFPIHRLHPFDRSNRVQFETNIDGDIAALSIQLEPAVRPIRFTKS